MTTSDFFQKNRALALLTASQRETFLCITHYAKKPITKRQLRKLALAAENYTVTRRRTTYSDHLRKFISLGVINEDHVDPQVIFITALGWQFRDELLKALINQATRGSDLPD